jgi:hypothetical protein
MYAFTNERAGGYARRRGRRKRASITSSLSKRAPRHSAACTAPRSVAAEPARGRVRAVTAAGGAGGTQRQGAIPAASAAAAVSGRGRGRG